MVFVSIVVDDFELFELFVAGDTSSVMPRFTSRLVSLGSSSWSQIATRFPALISFGRYVSSAWWGKPAIAVPSELRLVSVIPSTFAHSFASSS